MRTWTRRHPLSLLLASGLLALALSSWVGCSDDDGGTTPIDATVQEDGEIDGGGQDEFAQVTLVQTSDVHHHAAGYGPFQDYTPLDTTDNDMVLGGYARLASKIAEIRAEQTTANVPVLLIDSGDFMMGTLFDMSVPDPLAFKFIQLMGYDAITLGNHEFDWSPAGLAMLIGNAMASTEGFSVPIVASNLVTDGASTGDDDIEDLITAQVILPKLVIDLPNGLRIGLLGNVGAGADEDAVMAPPITFDHDSTFIQGLVDDLRDNDEVDLVVIISHGGVRSDGSGDDVDMAEDVNGIDIILSGHEHTATTTPLEVNGAIIYEPGEYGEWLSRMDINYNLTQGEIEDADFTLIPIDDTITGDASIQGMVEGTRQAIDTQLTDLISSSATPIAQLDYDMEPQAFVETGLGNFCADAMRTMASYFTGETYHLAVVPQGIIRDGLYRGDSDTISFMDLYNVLPLGISPETDQGLGYPLLTVFLHAADIKDVAEVAVSVAPAIGNSSAWLNFSGIRIEYDPTGAVTNQVTAIQTCQGAFSDQNCQAITDLTDTVQLYQAVVDLYTLMSLGVINDLGLGLSIIPKYSDGTPIDLTSINDILTLRIDIDPDPDFREAKPWMFLYQFVIRAFDDFQSPIGLVEFPLNYQPGGSAMNRLTEVTP